jgi:nucleoside-diphosphate-sugar epimerase|tara:strand:- start:2759 stop:3682 length:924 start_codon:yes stop_codon:yes gene_type:complete
MNLLITGCCGHIGSYLVENVYKINNIKKTFIVDNLESNRFYSIFNSKKKNNLNFLIKDLKDPNSLNDLKKIDYVIHLASMTNAEKSFGKKNSMYENNIKCLKTVINFCKKKKAKLIHISSTSVYGKQTKIVDENCEEKYLKPQSPYADIKLIEEKMLKKENKSLKYNTFRFGTIAGVSKGIRFHTAVNKFCFNAAINKDINVYKTALNQYRPYLSLRDAFKVFKFSIENDFFKNDIFNALSGNFTVNQIIKRIKKYKKKIKIKFVSSAIMNQLSYHVSQKKLNEEGLFLNSDIEKDIKETIKLLKNI